MAIRLRVLGSGSAGNATLIEGCGARLLLDAGFSCRELKQRLQGAGVEPHRLDGLVITHEHADHVRGAARFAATFGVPVYATAATGRAAGLDDDGHGGPRWSDAAGATRGHGDRGKAAGRFVEVAAGRAFAIGGLTLYPFAVPHDAVDTVGYVLEGEQERIGYATDLGHAPDGARQALRDCDLLMLESNHDVAMLQTGPYPAIVKQRVLSRHGHLDNEAAAELAGAVVSERTRLVVLAHLSRTNNRPDLALGAIRDRFARDGRRAPALRAAEQACASPWFEVS
jgi:phosphoribosyl 1,2-cyclic phosphodiesterase